MPASRKCADFTLSNARGPGRPRPQRLTAGTLAERSRQLQTAPAILPGNPNIGGTSSGNLAVRPGAGIPPDNHSRDDSAQKNSRKQRIQGGRRTPAASGGDWTIDLSHSTLKTQSNLRLSCVAERYDESENGSIGFYRLQDTLPQQIFRRKSLYKNTLQRTGRSCRTTGPEKSPKIHTFVPVLSADHTARPPKTGVQPASPCLYGSFSEQMFRTALSIVLRSDRKK